jgi:hypothetical protein
MKKAIFALFFLTLNGIPPLLQAQDTNSLRAQIVGTWRLVSATQRLENGTTRPDPATGEKGIGYLIYTETGQVCVVVGNPERSRWESVQAPTPQNLRNAFDGLVAYTGTFEVNEAEKYVVHHIEVDKIPNLAGTDRKRFCSIEGNRLVLRAAPPLPANVQEWKIVWERSGK